MITHSIARVIGVASVSVDPVWIAPQAGGVPWRYSRSVKTVARCTIDAYKVDFWEA